MHLSDAQDDFRAAEIVAGNATSPSGSRADFRASEIVAQNQAAVSSPLPRLMLAGVGMFMIYTLLTKGLK